MKTATNTPISPRARRTASQRGIDPSTIRGTGPNGRILEADVLRAASSGHPGASMPTGFAPPVYGKSLSPMRRAVAAKVTESFATVPHFYLRSQADVTALLQLQAQTLDAFTQHCGQKPTVTDFLLRAMVLALHDCPQANRIWQHGEIVALPTIDVGIVVQVADGLLVPVIHQADRFSMVELLRQRVAVVNAVRSGKFPTDMLQGAATSLSNLGKRRVDEFSPIISPPQSSMLAIGRVAERPAAFDGRLCLRQTINLTLAVDHRVLDGVPAAEYLDRVVELLEKPFLLLCDTCFEKNNG